MNHPKIVLHWFRRDLRLHDNTSLSKASQSGAKVIALFIFDTEILNELEREDARVSFIYETLANMHKQLQRFGASLLIRHGKVLDVFHDILEKFPIAELHYNRDYEPYAIQRDKSVSDLLKSLSVDVFSYKDQLIFEPGEILKSNKKPYTVFTPFKKKWLELFKSDYRHETQEVNFNAFHSFQFDFPHLSALGFSLSHIKVKPYTLAIVKEYADTRDYPAKESGSNLSPHLRFGTISIREIIRQLPAEAEVFRSELIWREFFMHILYHFPQVVHENFHKKYDGIAWRNNSAEFDLWCEGKTGYPMVDAGMRELRSSGYMHNRVRMVVAGFLCKHLLIDWRWGEAWFARHLLDFELGSNNGNWQWAAGTGCDAAPYFRVFNPIEQFRKFDEKALYVRKWVPEWDSLHYVKPIVEHKFARERALLAYKSGLAKLGQ